ncbi:MAG: hypothetical protein HZA16_13605 [Nitrospirae bacterium]|nr:hypothetical protein [Nitrospirota bacterium]
MRRTEQDNNRFLNLIVNCQEIESRNIEYSDKEIPKARSPFIKAMLKTLKLDAERHCIMEQMIIEGVKKEAVNLSPEELADLSGHLNRHLDNEERALSLAQEALKKGGSPVPSYLLQYLVADIQQQNTILKQFEDELKTVAIPTSATSKRFKAARAD